MNADPSLERAHDEPDVAQLTYSASTEGYQVLSRSGLLTPERERALVSRVPIAAGFGQTIPEFPTPEQVEALPRRYIYLAEGEHAVYWHVAPAGRDASGRPDNVFAHIVQTPLAAPSDVRAINRWRSPDWLTPFGAADVAKARVGQPQAPRPGSVVTRERVLTFLTDPAAWRIGTLPVLLDAVEAAIGGQHVVLGVESQTNAAMWIGTISYLMAQSTAARWSWSLWETPDTLDRTVEMGIGLCCLPRALLGAVAQQSGRVILDELGPVELGEVGGPPHRTADGNEVAAGDWSALASSIFALADDPIHALTEIDDVGRSAWPAIAHPAWALAMVVGARREEISGQESVVRRVVMKHTPDGLPEDTGLTSTALAIVERDMELTGAALWQALAGQRSMHSPVTRLLAKLYVRHGMRDREWLMGQVAAPHLTQPERPALSAPESQEIADEVLDLLASARARLDTQAEPEDHAVYVLRLLDFVSREGFTPGEATQELQEHIDSAVDLFSPSWTRLWARVGELHEPLLRDLVRPSLSLSLVTPDEQWYENLEHQVMHHLYPHRTRHLATSRSAPSLLDMRAILHFGLEKSEADRIHRWALQALAGQRLNDPSRTTRHFLRQLYGLRGPDHVDVLAVEAHRGSLDESILLHALLSADSLTEAWFELATALRPRGQSLPEDMWPAVNRVLTTIGRFATGDALTTKDAEVVLAGVETYLRADNELIAFGPPAGSILHIIGLADIVYAASMLCMREPDDLTTPAVDRLLDRPAPPRLSSTSLLDQLTRLEPEAAHKLLVRVTAVATLGDPSVQPRVSRQRRLARVAERDVGHRIRHLEASLRSVWAAQPGSLATPRECGEAVLDLVPELPGRGVQTAADVKRFEQTFSAWLDRVAQVKGVLGRRRSLFSR